VSAPLLELEGIRKTYPARRGGRLHALRGVDLTVEAGEAVALVGESGCGKSTLARCALCLERPDAGKIRHRGQEVQGLSDRKLRPFRRAVQLIFQDPLASLDPRMTVAQSVAEPLLVHRLGGAREVPDLLAAVALEDGIGARYPHEISGGQRQRVALARALASRPELIVADEPVSSLDLPTRARLLGLMASIRQEHGVAFLLITHDLAGVARLATKVAVMYLGQVVERGPAELLLSAPTHPYAQALLDAAPRLEQGTARPGAVLPGEPPSPLELPGGCAFRPRCPLYARRGDRRCETDEPELRRTGDGHAAACHEANAD